MMESSNEYQSNKISFDAIKIGLASPEKIREWSIDHSRIFSGEANPILIASNEILLL